MMETIQSIHILQTLDLSKFNREYKIFALSDNKVASLYLETYND